MSFPYSRPARSRGHTLFFTGAQRFRTPPDSAPHIPVRCNIWKEYYLLVCQFVGNLGDHQKTPALTKRDAGSRSLHVMPFPVANLRQVLPIFSDVFLVFDALVADRLLDVGGNRAQAHSVDHVRA